MDRSTASAYRSKYTGESRRLSSNTLQQQQQIQQLEQKVDLILLHNNQLIEQNQKLKTLLANSQAHRQFQTRTKSSDTEIYILRRQYERKCLELETITKQTIAEKESITQQLDGLNQVIRTLTNSRQLVGFQKQELERRLNSYNEEKNLEINRIRQEMENQIYETSLKKQIEHKQEMREKQMEFNKKFEKKLQQWQNQKNKIQQLKMNTIINMEQNMEKQKQEIRKSLEHSFQERLGAIQRQADEKCRKIRNQSESYIKLALQQQKQDSLQPELELKRQIQGLRQSLEQRQKVIQSLLKQQRNKTNHLTLTGTTGSASYYSQVQQLRKKIKQLTQSFFKQSQLLKVKVAAQHQFDKSQTIKVYENKIQLLSFRISILQQQKLKIRENYQQEIRSKMKQRQRFQIQVSKLKNYIRKMKIQLQSYGKQVRLNIEGIRDQANSFSMSILGQLGQQKSKKGFYQQQMRKMRQIITLKDHQIQTALKQNEQKVKFYQEMFRSTRQTVQDLNYQLQTKQQKSKQQLNTLRQNAKQQLKKQKQFWTQQNQQNKKQINNLKKANQQLMQSVKQLQISKTTAEKQLEIVRHNLEQCKAHIDELKLQLQMNYQQNANQERNALKQHYERIIKQMYEDKQILKETNSAQNQQLSKLVKKYNILEKSLEKTLSTMKKKSQLESRVMELGMDNNLVKNLSEIFRKSQQGKEN